MIEPHQHHAIFPDVRPCPPTQRREALLQLAAAHDPEQQAALSTALKRMSTASDEEWQGLLVNYQKGQIKDAIWAQPLPENMAQLWLPLPGVEAEQIHVLLRAAHAWVKTHNIRLCHLELSPQAPVSEVLLMEHGMQRLVCLEHLTGSSRRRLAMNEAIPLSLQPLCEFSQAEQLALLTAVGQGSLDSRPLRDILSVKELLAGFYQQDPQAPQHWYAIGYQNTVVGVLLLAPRPTLGRWELMLMGLTPDWRGKGLGRSLLNKALELAQQAGAQEMVLGVDDVNLPAKRLYQQAGFVRYAQQRLLAWKGGDERGEAPK
ncbi:GNAT family N-acetyltransferase [Vreelandella boliviensis]|uniref:GNAT family N-acetyltransferase n=1 Tax=Vreelandella boliviensis TaxID=223527 RepID=UPI000309E215|nr:GNAT family N-acetyltransferase [Halomonas boliviensis]